MARIIFTIGEIRGSIGNLTFQKNGSGNIVRLKPKGTKSQTPKQSDAHSKLQNSLYDWQQLNSEDRDNWNTFASVHTKTNSFGEQKKLTGLNWFTSINYQLQQIGQPKITTPPEYNVPPGAPSFDIIMTATDISIVINDDIDFSVNSLLVFCSLPTKRQKGSMNQLQKFSSAISSYPTPPPPETYYLLADSGDALQTDAGDNLQPD